MTGRMTAPIFHTAWKAQKISGQFGIMTTTRSSGPTPRARSTAASFRASSSCSAFVVPGAALEAHGVIDAEAGEAVDGELCCVHPGRAFL